MTVWGTREPDPASPKSELDRRATLARRCFQLAFMLLVIGLVLGLLALWGQRQAAATAAWRNPADTIQAASVAPDLALLSLAGVPDEQVLALAVGTGELATAHALLALSVDLSDAQRMNGWLWLAYRYQITDQTQQAAQAYRLAGSGAIISPGVPDLLRVETLLAAGKGLIELHDSAGARLFAGQAAIIGAYSPHLTAYQRHSLLERLVAISVRAGGKRDDWHVLAKAVRSGTAEGQNVANSGSIAGADWRDIPVDTNAGLLQARDLRRLSAAQRLEEVTGARDDDAESASAAADGIEALRTALLSEDTAVGRYVQSGEMDASAQAALQTRLRWLALKRRIAAGGFGPGLMPEWESDREAIDAALTGAWTDWLALQADQKGTGFLNGLQARQAITAAYWGLYPDAPIADLVSAAHSAGGYDGIHLTVLETGSPPVVGWSK